MKFIARALAWICVAVPLGWGVYQSVQKSLPLFKTHSQPATKGPQAR
jgi:hypothetical protein